MPRLLAVAAFVVVLTPGELWAAREVAPSAGTLQVALFHAVNLAVLLLWVPMVVLPRWQVTRRVLRSPLVLVPLPAMYVALLAPVLPELMHLLNQPHLDAVAGLLGWPSAALVAWVHFLAFDLFVGRWIYLDSQARDISPWVTAPVLLLTLMVGPCGLLAYLAVRWASPPPPERRVDEAQTG